MKRVLYFVVMLAGIIALSSCGGKNKSNETDWSSDTLSTYEDAETEAYLDTLTLKKCQLLYEELLAFKQEKEFQEAGLAGKQAYIDWTDKVKQFAEEEESKRLMKSGIVAGDLRTLADLYVISKGKETRDTESLKRHFETAFAPNPDLEEAASVQVSESSPKSIVGKWDVNNKFVPEAGFYIEIYEQDGAYFAYQLFRDGSSSTDRLRKEGSKYHITGNNNHEYYQIKSGQLRICGIDGDFTDASGFVVTRK